MRKGVNIDMLLRALIGTMLIVSGFEKLISPHENFLYVIQGYELLPPVLEQAAALVMPWLELFVGAFLLLGLWLVWALRAAAVMMGAFIFIVAQAILRGLPIVDCGCFGEALHVPLFVILLFDTMVLIVLDFLVRRIKRTSVLSLDRCWEKGNEE